MFKKFIFVVFLLLPVLSFAEFRIVSLAPNVTEILFKIGAGDYVVGVSDRCDFPEEAKAITEVGSYYRPSLEKILMLNPTHVFGMREGYTKQLKNKLDKFGIENRFFQAHDYEDIINMIEMIGGIVHKPVDNITGEMREVFGENAAGGNKSAVFLINAKPAYAAGGGNFVNDIMNCAGLRNPLQGESKSFPQISYEKLYQMQPDYIILAKRHGSSNGNKFFYEKMEYFNKDVRIIEVEPNIFLRPSYRIMQACRILKQQIR